MNNLPDLCASRTLGLLARLKETGTAFAHREAQLSRELGTRRLALNRSRLETETRVREQGEARIADAASHFQALEEHARSVFQTRRTRIEQFRNRTLLDLPTRARQTKEAWMGNLQMRDFRAQTERTAGLDAAAAAHTEAARRLETHRTTLLSLEKQARRAFLGYWRFQKMLRTEGAAKESPTDRPMDELLAEAETRLRAFQRWTAPLVFSFTPLPVLLLAVAVGGVLLSSSLGVAAWVLAGVLAAGLAGLHFMGGQSATPDAEALIGALGRAREALSAEAAAIQSEYDARRKDVMDAYDRAHEELARQWNRADTIEEEFETRTRARLTLREPRANARNEAMLQERLGRIEAEGKAQLGALHAEAEAALAEVTASFAAEAAHRKAEEQQQWGELQAEWTRTVEPLYAELLIVQGVVETRFPEWTPQQVEAWSAPSAFPSAIPFGRLRTNLTLLPEGLPKDPRLALPGCPQLTTPLALSFPAEGSLLFETAEQAGDGAAAVFNQIILRLLATTPPGKVSFTIFDPVGLGENFAGLMQLADYEESLINRRIWTQRDQIEERLEELCEHLEKVIQMYLRNQYATIAEYNEQAGSVAEKYHFVVVADFPTGFTEAAAARLQSIATSGARCGVFTLLHWDKRSPLPDGIAAEELRANTVTLRRDGPVFVAEGQKLDGATQLLLDAPPAPELALALTHKIGKASVDSNRVEVPFSLIAPAPDEFWTNDTTQELRVAIGRTGATKQQYLAIGKGTRQHALFAGKTGSGKSTLFHVIITNLALSCSPEEVEFYLIDFKKGVEFKCYAEKRLPHARVVAIESDREFALSVLQRVDEELKRRGDLFRTLGVQDIPGYRKAGGTEPIPRTLLIIDEFQEFFVEDDAIAQTASLLFDRIVRQGRAFGIHVLLGSQTLGGAYSLARATLGQMVIRVALQCNEADAYLIMDESNAAPRLLSRPGEGIYNDDAGALEGNSPFQVVWLPDGERDEWLDKVSDLAQRRPGGYPAPIVFEGNAPASLADNALLQAALASRPAGVPAIARAWLGAPNSIKGPTEAAFQSQGGSNLFIVGQREEASLNLLCVSLLALAAQYPTGTARFVFLHATAPGTPDGDLVETVRQALGSRAEFMRPAESAETVNQLATLLKERAGGGHDGLDEEASVFFFIHGLHKFKKLRKEDDFSFSMSDSDAGPDPGAQFNEIVAEGASHGIHLLITLDTFNNVNRFLNRKALSEFEMRVVFQMSANDSASLVDSPKASTLGLHRALFYNEHEGTLETFRPYATPSAEWFRHAGEKIAGK